MFAWVWRSRLTWRAAFVVTVAACLTILATTGIGGRLGAYVTLAAIGAWFVLVARMADNETRHFIAVATERGRPIAQRKVRRLLFPWWARAGSALGALAAFAAASSTLDSELIVALVFLAYLGAVWLVERTVVSIRLRRAA